MGPVQEKETVAKVSAIKKIPVTLPSPLFVPAVLVMAAGRVISNRPKNDKENMMKTAKKKILTHALVAMELKISGCTLPAI